MILFDDGRRFQIAGTVLSDGTTTIPFSAVSLGAKPGSFPLDTTGVSTPIIYVHLNFVDGASVVAAMSMPEYNKLALAEAQRAATPQRRMPALAQRVAAGIARRCGSCGRK